MLLSNTGVIPMQSPLYGTLKDFAVPIFIAVILLNIDVRSAFTIAGPAVAVMLFGTIGVIVGAVVSYSLVHPFLDTEVWKAFGALTGSWIGGTANLAAVGAALNTPEHLMGIALITDGIVVMSWLPILLASRSWSRWFNTFTGISPERLRTIAVSDGQIQQQKAVVEVRHIVWLLALAFLIMWTANTVAERLPVLEPVFAAGTWKILLVTTFSLLLACTPARHIPGGHALGMTLLYLFFASMGARADLHGLTQAPWFLAGGYLWIMIHGFFCLVGARIMKVDVGTAAIASAANIGGAISAPVVAAYHRQSLVPLSLLMALIGYAIGNYGALITAQLCYWIGS